MILKASSGMDYEEFLQFLCVIATPRLAELHSVCGCVEIGTSPALCFSRLSQQLSEVFAERKSFFKYIREGSPTEVSADYQNTAEYVDDQCTQAAWFEHLKPRDHLVTYLQRVMEQRDLKHAGEGAASSSQPLIFSTLFAALPVEVQAAVKSGIAEHHSWQFSLAVFRSFELCSIFKILEELLQQPGLNVVRN